MTPEAHARGWTLVETLMVLSILAITVTLAGPSLQTFIEKRRLDGWVTLVAADLQQARSEGIARNRSVRWAWSRTDHGSCYLLFVGPQDGCSCSPNAAPACIDDAELIKAVDLPTAHRVSLDVNVNSIVFDPVHGTSTPAATIRVSNARVGAVHHIVNVLGRIRSCSPGAALLRYPAC